MLGGCALKLRDDEFRGLGVAKDRSAMAGAERQEILVRAKVVKADDARRSGHIGVSGQTARRSAGPAARGPAYVIAAKQDANVNTNREA